MHSGSPEAEIFIGSTRVDAEKGSNRVSFRPTPEGLEAIHFTSTPEGQWVEMKRSPVTKSKGVLNCGDALSWLV